MKAYSYDELDGAYAGETEAQVLPLRENLPDNDPTKFLVPAHATTTAPPTVSDAGKIARYNGSGWEVAEDHRGEAGFVDGVPVTITTVGPYPPGWSKDLPQPPENRAAQARNEAYIAAVNAIDAGAAKDLAGMRECLKRIEAVLLSQVAK